MHLVADLVYLQSRAVDNLRYISEVSKMKMHNLVELMYKDSRIDVGMLNAIGIRYRLEEIHQHKKEAREHRNEENNLTKYAVKLVLLKFNG